MGWWKVENTENIIGDRPLDVLGAAVMAIVQDYQRAFGRKPTGAEWESLLHAVLGAEEEEARATDQGVVRKVQIEFS